MKKVLLATTVLAMSSTVAAASGHGDSGVKLSGDARMGIIRDFNKATNINSKGKKKFEFTSRARVTLTLFGHSDNGLSFGGSFRADNAVAAETGTAGSVYISGVFGKLSMGDVDGAAASAVGHVDGVGLTDLGSLNENTFIANGGHDSDLITGAALGLTGDPSIVYAYTAGDAALYASVTQPGFQKTDSSGDKYDGIAYGLGASYALGNYKLVAGFETLSVDGTGATAKDKSDLTQIAVGGDAAFAGLSVKARYTQGEFKVKDAGSTDKTKTNRISASATYKMADISLTGFGVFGDSKTNSDGKDKDTAFGVGASYDLGGGALLIGGVARKSSEPAVGSKSHDTAADLGVSFSF